MATITCLPPEIINIILGYSDITIEDIHNFRCVCKQFQEAAKYNEYLKKKIFQRWSSAKKFYDKQSKENVDEESEEKEQSDKRRLNFIETGKICVKKLRKCVSQLIYIHYHEPNSNKNYDTINYIRYIDNYVQLQDIFYLNEDLRRIFCLLIKEPINFIIYSFFIDELKNLITQSPRTDCNLTERYCNTKMYYFLRQMLVKRKWRIYEARNDIDPLFERIATFMAQWIQPQKDIFYSSVQASLDSIAQGVLKYLKEKHPDHSIFWTSTETFSYLKNNNIKEDCWNETEGTQILDALQDYIFNHLNFRLSELNDQNGEDMCIDYVLKNKYGQGIILVIIYQSVARRLGLRFQIVRLSDRPYEFCILWRSKYAGNSSKNVKGFSEIFEKLPNDFVETLLNSNGDRTLNDVPSSNAENFLSYRAETFDDKIVTFEQIWKRSLDIMTYQKKYIMGLRFNVYNLHLIKNKYSYCFYFRKMAIIENIKFKIGMIVKYSDAFQNDCTGVIIGLHQQNEDAVRIRNSSSPNEWFAGDDCCVIMPLRFCSNDIKKEQTMYIILTENNEMCYVGEDSLKLTTPKWINNSEIGRYFRKFKGTHYVPNRKLAHVYPRGCYYRPSGFNNMNIDTQFTICALYMLSICYLCIHYSMRAFA